MLFLHIIRIRYKYLKYCYRNLFYLNEYYSELKVFENLPTSLHDSAYLLDS